MPSIPENGCDRAGIRPQLSNLVPCLLLVYHEADGFTDEVSCCVRFTERPVSTWATQREGLRFCQQLQVYSSILLGMNHRAVKNVKDPGSCRVLQTMPTAGEDAKKRHQVSQTMGVCRWCWDRHTQCGCAKGTGYSKHQHPQVH